MKLSRRPRTPAAGYLSRACTAGFLIAAAGVGLAGFLPQPFGEPGRSTVSWVLLAVLFGIAEISVLHVQMRGGARTVSLSEAPLVLGLFFTAPPDLVLARLVGPLWSSPSSAASRGQARRQRRVLLVEVSMAVEAVPARARRRAGGRHRAPGSPPTRGAGQRDRFGRSRSRSSSRSSRTSSTSAI